MNQIKNLLREDAEKLKEESERWFLERGYVHNEVFGWEKPEVLENFGLDPNINGVPWKEIDEVEEKTVWKDERDTFGNKTGRKIADFQEKITGKKKIIIEQNWLNYQNYFKSKV